MRFIKESTDVRLDIDGHPFSVTNVNIPQHPPLKFFKVVPEAFDPIFATDHAGCFDLRACLPEGTLVKGFSAANETFKVPITGAKLTIAPGDRMLVPTGLILDIPVGYKVDLYARSGLALKQGLILANNVGKIDSDYVDPTFILLTNTSSVPQVIAHGDRIAQAEMVHDIAYELVQTPDQPQQKTNRQGGLGSTGVK